MPENDFTSWVPADYLREYYQALDHDEVRVIGFFVASMVGVPSGPTLCFGCGPTLHHVFATAPHTQDLYLADYLPQNLAEIDRWKRDEAGAHDWRPFVRYTLSCELRREPSDDEVGERQVLTRKHMSGLLHADAALVDPLGKEYRGYFQTVLSPFCADSITASRDDWHRYSRNVASLVKPGGRLLVSALARCTGYRVGSRTFPSANVDVGDMRAVLLEDFAPASIHVEEAYVPEHAPQGYSTILLARADK